MIFLLDELIKLILLIFNSNTDNFLYKIITPNLSIFRIRQTIKFMKIWKVMSLKGLFMLQNVKIHIS